MDFVGGTRCGQSDGGVYIARTPSELRMFVLRDDGETDMKRTETYHHDQTSGPLPFWRHESLDTPERIAAALKAHEARPVRRFTAIG